MLMLYVHGSFFFRILKFQEIPAGNFCPVVGLSVKLTGRMAVSHTLHVFDWDLAVCAIFLTDFFIFLTDLFVVSVG